MTDKERILAFLNEVQLLQKKATKVDIAIYYYPEVCSFRVFLKTKYEKTDLGFWRLKSLKDNQIEMARLYRFYNRYEHD